MTTPVNMSGPIFSAVAARSNFSQASLDAIRGGGRFQNTPDTVHVEAPKNTKPVIFATEAADDVESE